MGRPTAIYQILTNKIILLRAVKERCIKSFTQGLELIRGLTKAFPEKGKYELVKDWEIGTIIFYYYRIFKY